MSTPPRFRYEQLAQFIEQQVRSGTLAPGAPAPSLRELSRQHGASLTTAVQAYRLLEDRGVLSARPQSGFYVHGTRLVPPVPNASKASARPRDVSQSGLMRALLEHASDERFVALGCAIPSVELLASRRLDGLLARTARTDGARHNVYLEARGWPALRHEIARRALRWGHAANVDQIVVTCGATEALALALKAVARPGDVIGIESPTYFGLLQLLRAQGLQAVELATSAETGVRIDALRDTLRQHKLRACVLSSSFSNPLGFTMPEADKLAVLRLLRQHRATLIEDDVYGDLHFDAVRPPPFKALDRHDNVLYCASFSKTLAPGYRMGWIDAGPRVDQVIEAKFSTTLCGPVLQQVALAEYLACGGYDHHLRRLRRLLAGTMQRMAHEVALTFPAGTRLSRPRGGFVLWVELDKRVDTRALFLAALEQGVCLAPGAIFSATGQHGHCLRLSGGQGWSPRLQAGIGVVGDLVKKALARSSRA